MDPKSAEDFLSDVEEPQRKSAEDFLADIPEPKSNMDAWRAMESKSIDAKEAQRQIEEGIGEASVNKIPHYFSKVGGGAVLDAVEMATPGMKPKYSYGENFASALMGEEKRPIDEQAADLWEKDPEELAKQDTVWKVLTGNKAAFAANAGISIADMLPLMSVSGSVGKGIEAVGVGAKAAHALASGLVFGFDENGFNPKQAAIMTAFPYVSEFGGRLAASTLEKLGVEVVSPVVKKALDAFGGLVSSQAFMDASSADVYFDPNISAADKAKHFIHGAAINLAMHLPQIPGIATAGIDQKKIDQASKEATQEFLSELEKGRESKYATPPIDDFWSKITKDLPTSAEIERKRQEDLRGGQKNGLPRILPNPLEANTPPKAQNESAINTGGSDQTSIQTRSGGSEQTAPTGDSVSGGQENSGIVHAESRELPSDQGGIPSVSEEPVTPVRPEVPKIVPPAEVESPLAQAVRRNEGSRLRRQTQPKLESPEGIASSLGVKFNGFDENTKQWMFTLQDEGATTTFTAPVGATLEQVKQKADAKKEEFSGGQMTQEQADALVQKLLEENKPVEQPKPLVDTLKSYFDPETGNMARGGDHIKELAKAASNEDLTEALIWSQSPEANPKGEFVRRFVGANIADAMKARGMDPDAIAQKEWMKRNGVNPEAQPADLLANQKEDFALVPQKGTDGDRIAEQKEKAAQREADVVKNNQTLDLDGNPPEVPGWGKVFVHPDTTPDRRPPNSLISKLAAPELDGWKNKKLQWTGYSKPRVEGFAVHPEGIYAVSIYFDTPDKPYAELLTKRMDGGRKGWERARNAFDGTPEQVAAEAQRRTDFINRQKAKENPIGSNEKPATPPAPVAEPVVATGQPLAVEAKPTVSDQAGEEASGAVVQPADVKKDSQQPDRIKQTNKEAIASLHEFLGEDLARKAFENHQRTVFKLKVGTMSDKAKAKAYGQFAQDVVRGDKEALAAIERIQKQAPPLDKTEVAKSIVDHINFRPLLTSVDGDKTATKYPSYHTDFEGTEFSPALGEVLVSEASPASTDLAKTNTRRLTAFQNEDGSVAVLGTYKDRGDYFVSPLSGKGYGVKLSDFIKSVDGKQTWTPIASMLLKGEVHNFAKHFESIHDYNEQVGDAATEGVMKAAGDAEAVEEGMHEMDKHKEMGLALDTLDGLIQEKLDHFANKANKFEKQHFIDLLSDIFEDPENMDVLRPHIGEAFETLMADKSFASLPAADQVVEVRNHIFDKAYEKYAARTADVKKGSSSLPSSQLADSLGGAGKEAVAQPGQPADGTASDTTGASAETPAGQPRRDVEESSEGRASGEQEPTARKSVEESRVRKAMNRSKRLAEKTQQELERPHDVIDDMGRVRIRIPTKQEWEEKSGSEGYNGVSSAFAWVTKTGTYREFREAIRKSKYSDVLNKIFTADGETPDEAHRHIVMRNGSENTFKIDEMWDELGAAVKVRMNGGQKAEDALLEKYAAEHEKLDEALRENKGRKGIKTKVDELRVGSTFSQLGYKLKVTDIADGVVTAESTNGRKETIQFDRGSFFFPEKGSLEHPEGSAPYEDPNVPFSKSQGEPTGIRLEEAQSVVDQSVKNWKNAPAVEVVNDPNLTHNGSNVEGYYDPRTKKIVLNSAFLSDQAHVRRVLAGEAFAHFGLKGVLGDSYSATMRDIFAKIPKETIDRLRAEYGADKSNEYLAEEFIDDIAQTEAGKGIWQNVWTKIKDFVAKVFGVDSTEREVRELLQKSKAFLEHGDAQKVEAKNATLFAKGIVRIGGPLDYSLRAYHGTPHKVDRFSTEKIGTGEGAQVFGYGLYFAENYGVADAYRKTLSDNFVNREVLEKYFKPGDVVEGWGGHDKVISFDWNNGDWSVTVQSVVKGPKGEWVNDPKSWQPRKHKTFPMSKDLDAKGIYRGNTYTVELEATPDNLLDWDKPISDQSKFIQDAVKDVIAFRLNEMRQRPSAYTRTPEAIAEDIKGSDIYEILSTRFKKIVPENKDPMAHWTSADGSMFRGDVEVGDDRKASDYLNSLGIKGIKYLDQLSRVPGADKYNAKWDETGTKAEVFDRKTGQSVGVFDTFKEADKWIADNADSQTRNFVIFDDSIIKITHENGKELTPAEALQAQSGEIQYSLAKSRTSYTKKRAFASEHDEVHPGLEVAAGYGSLSKIKRSIADRLNLSPKAQSILRLNRQEDLAGMAFTDVALDTYYAARSMATTPFEKTSVARAGMDALSHEQSLHLKIAKDYAKQRDLIYSRSFMDKAFRLDKATVETNLAEQALTTFQNQVRFEAGKILREMKQSEKITGRVDQLTEDLRAVQNMTQYGHAVAQRVQWVLDVIGASEEGRELLTTSTKNDAQKLVNIYFDLAKGTKQDNIQERTFVDLAARVLVGNRNLTQKLVALKLIKDDPHVLAAVTEFGKKFAASAKTNPEAAISQIVRATESKVRKAIDAEQAWLALHKDVVGEVEKFNDLKQAMQAIDAMKAAPDYNQLIKDVHADGEAIRRPDVVVEKAAKEGLPEHNEFMPRQKLIAPDGTLFSIDYGDTKESARATADKLKRYQDRITAWLDNPDNANSPDREYWQKQLTFASDVLRSSNVINPAHNKPLLDFDLYIPDFIFEGFSTPAGKLAETAKVNFVRASVKNRAWVNERSPIIIRKLTQAAKSHGYDVKKGFNDYRRDVLSPIAFSFRINKKVRAGDVLSNGIQVTAQDMEAFKAQGEAFHDLFTAIRNTGAEKVMAPDLVYDEYGDGIFVLRKPLELGAEAKSTLPQMFSDAAIRLSRRVHNIIEKGGGNEAIEKLLDEEDNFKQYVSRFLGERHSDYSKQTDWEALYSQLSDQIRKGDPDAPRSIDDIVNYIYDNLPTDDKVPPTIDAIRADVIGEMAGQLDAFYKNHGQVEIPQTKVQTTYRPSGFREGFKRYVGSSFFYEYGVASVPEMRSRAIDADNFHLERLVNSIQALIQDAQRSLDEFSSASPEQQDKLREKNLAAYKAGEAYQLYDKTENKILDLKHMLAHWVPALEGQRRLDLEMLTPMRRIFKQTVGNALTGLPTFIKVLVGSQVKEGAMNGAMTRWAATAYFKAALSMATSAIRMVPVSIGAIPVRLATNLPSALKAAKDAKGGGVEKMAAFIEQEFSKMTDAQFRHGKWWNSMKELGMTPDDPVGIRMANMWSLPDSRGEGYNPNYSPDKKLIGAIQKVGWRAWTGLELTTELVKAIFPQLQYNVAYDSAYRNSSYRNQDFREPVWYGVSGLVDTLDAQARHSFDVLQKTGKLKNFNLDDPSDPKNADLLTANLVLPQRLFPKTQTDLNVARNWFHVGTDVGLVENTMRFWKRLAETPEADRPKIRYLAPEETDYEKAVELARRRGLSLGAKALADVHHALPTNRPYVISGNPILSLLVPYVGWGAQTTRQAFSVLGKATRDPQYHQAMLWTGVALTLLTGLTASVLNGETEKKLIDLGKRWVYNQETNHRSILEAKDAKQFLQIMGSDATSYISLVNTIFNSLLGEEGHRSTNGISVYAVDKVNAWTDFIKGLINTKDLTYGVAQLTKSELPWTRPFINRLESQVGRMEQANVKTIITKHAPEEVVDNAPSRGGFAATPTELTPFKVALANAIFKGEGVEVAYNNLVAKAKEMGKPDPEKFAQQVFATLNPYRQAVGTTLTEEQRKEFFNSLNEREAAVVKKAEENYAAAGETIGATANLVKGETRVSSGSSRSSGSSGGGSFGGGGSSSKSVPFTPLKAPRTSRLRKVRAPKVKVGKLRTVSSGRRSRIRKYSKTFHSGSRLRRSRVTLA